jgi:hypothetical protein
VSRVVALGVAALSLLGACAHRGQDAGGMGTPGWSIRYPDAEATSKAAHVGKRFYAKPAGACFYENGHEARWTSGGVRVASGELPPGLTLEDGVIGGVPKSAGTFNAKIEFSDVNCAGKSLDTQSVDVVITVK